MNLELKNYKSTQEEFEALTLLEKRQYIIQTEQEETMWYQKAVAQIQYISFWICVALGLIYLIGTKL
jgi:hypothetical protein